MISETVKQRVKSAVVQVMGKANDNPILNTRKYIVEFPDGHESALMANLMAENMYTQCDAHENQHLLFKAIVNHLYDEKVALQGEDQHHQQKTTKGWTLVVEWNHG